MEDDESLSLPVGPWRDVNGLHEAEKSRKKGANRRSTAGEGEGL